MTARLGTALLCLWTVACAPDPSTPAGTGGGDGDGGDTGCSEPLDWHADQDGDGFGDPAVLLSACEAPVDAVLNDQDCDDQDAAVFPGADEVCNGQDDDCNGQVDDAPVDGDTWYADLDGDGYGDPGAPVVTCEAPQSHVANADDCDDSTSLASPLGEEVCDGLDNDCDGTVDFGHRVPSDFARIQDAADALPDGSHICVEPGLHSDPFDLSDRTLWVVGSGGSAASLIDLGGARPVVRAEGEDTLVVFDGLGFVGFDAVHSDPETAHVPAMLFSGGRVDLDWLDFDGGALEVSGGAQVDGGLIQARDMVLAVSDVTVRDLELVLSGAAGDDPVALSGAFISSWDTLVQHSRVRYAGASLETDGSPTACLVGGMLLAIHGGQSALKDIEMSDHSLVLDCTEGVDVSGGLLSQQEVVGTGDGLLFNRNTVALSGETLVWKGLAHQSESTLWWSALEAIDNSAVLSGSRPSSVQGLVLHADGAVQWLAGGALWRNRITVQGGSTDQIFGGAIFAHADELDLNHIDIRSTEASAGQTVDGGALYLAPRTDGTALLYNFQLLGNAATAGAQVLGGGLYVGGHGADTLLRNGDVVGNTATASHAGGGGIAILDSGSGQTRLISMSIQSNLASGATGGGQDAAALYLSPSSPRPTISYSNIWDHSGTVLANLADPVGTLGNLSADPLYTDTSDPDPVLWAVDLGAGSPNIDAGSTDATYKDDDGTRNDIGAFGGPFGAD